MAEIQSSEPQSSHHGVDTPLPSTWSVTPSPVPRPKSIPLHQLYALPAPIRTFPLPSFYPNNPLSLCHVVYTWMSQALFPPAAEPSVVYQGIWSSESHSVHIVDEKSMRGLWEQGFYGKGTLSRSEPNWLKREKVRRGLIDGLVIEQVTLDRREERKQVKWERARAELDAIRQVQLEEARQAVSNGPSTQLSPGSLEEWAAPVGPLELLALPNSHAGLPNDSLSHTALGIAVSDVAANGTPPPPAQDNHPIANGHVVDNPVNGNANGKITQNGGGLNGIVKLARSSTASSESSDEPAPLKRRKSVRFSPKVDSTTYQLSDPPSPSRAMLNGRSNDGQFPDGPGTSTLASIAPASSFGVNETPVSGIPTRPLPLPETEIQNKEHLQLTPEEAFFLTFGLGALLVRDPATKSTLPTEVLLDLFRQHSYFPTRDGGDLQPYDNFLVSYAVYHHFRSLGWVPRGGIKFGVDWLLYVRGPVFDHAEFGVIIVPSFSHPWWKESGRPLPLKSWHWLHGINRVLSHVMKSLVLVYVEVPPPPVFDEAFTKGPAAVFKLYKIQEVMVRRWSSNRNR